MTDNKEKIVPGTLLISNTGEVVLVVKYIGPSYSEKLIGLWLTFWGTGFTYRGVTENDFKDFEVVGTIDCVKLENDIYEKYLKDKSKDHVAVK